MKILIVDDEKLASTRVARILGELGYKNINIFNDALDSLIDVSKNKYDLVFLDIQMPNINGLELANKILEAYPSTFIVFQTAYDQYAIEAYRVGGVDYILKPTTKENIQNAVEKVKKYMATLPLKEAPNRKIMGKRGNNIYLVELDDIYYIKADLDEVIVRIKETDFYVRKKIGQMATLLEDKSFFRIHRSIIVNVDKIHSMQTKEQSKLEIFFRDIDVTVTSSKEGAKEFRDYLDLRSL